MVPTLVAVPGKSKQRFMMLPPPPDRADPLSIVDLGKAAEVLYRHSSCCCWTVLWSHNLSRYTQSCIHLEQLRLCSTGGAQRGETSLAAALTICFREVALMSRVALSVWGKVCRSERCVTVQTVSLYSCKVALWHMQVLLVVVPGKTGAAALDDSGLQALSLLRQLGMPALIGVASGACPDQATNAAAKMKDKAAARKRAAAVLASEVYRLHKLAVRPSWDTCMADGARHS